EIIQLDISCHHGNILNKITGGIDLSDFISLVKLRCRNNKLTNLRINNLKMLEEIDLDCPSDGLDLHITDCYNVTVRYFSGDNQDGIDKIESLKRENNKLKQIITELEDSPIINKKKKIFKEDEVSEMGFGDTVTVSGDKAVLEAVKATYTISEGTNQILFVDRERKDIDEKVMKLYNSLKDEIFGEKIFKYSTIVRIHFGFFTEEERYNPSLKDQSDTMIELNRKSRSESRKILVNYLSTCENVYRSSKLKEVVSKFDYELNNRGIDNKQLIKPNFKTARLDLVVNALKCIPAVVTIVQAVAFGSSCQII
ncbi:4294_t:CDS:2, partial [Gigaspora margarita]